MGLSYDGILGQLIPFLKVEKAESVPRPTALPVCLLRISNSY